MAITILIAIASMAAYRAGGTSLGTKWRDIGCSALALVWMALYGPAVDWWAHTLALGLMFGALTTYWSRLFENEDNFFMHGFMIGCAYLPYALTAGIWGGVFVRAFILSLFMGGLNWAVHKFNIPHSDWIEELSRGAVIILTLGLLRG